jgi:protein TonB
VTKGIESGAVSRDVSRALAAALLLNGCGLYVPPPTAEERRAMDLCAQAPEPKKPKAPNPRVPHVIAGPSWDCPFPPTVRSEWVDDVYVILRVKVAATGRAEEATVLCDPGFAFASAARACALKQPYVAAQNEDGQGVSGAATVRVHFVR